MKTRVLHWGYNWPKPRCHMDIRVCPTCYGDVNGDSQSAHAQDHEALQEWYDSVEERLIELAKRCGIAEEDIDVPARWTAVVDGFSAVDGPPREAAEG